MASNNTGTAQTFVNSVASSAAVKDKVKEAIVGASSASTVSGVGSSQTGSTNKVSSGSVSSMTGQAVSVAKDAAKTAVATKTKSSTPDINNLTYAEKAPDLQPFLDQWRATAEQQATNRIDFATNKAVTEAKRNEEDAAEAFQAQRNQVDEDEAKAKYNQVLYSEARGDRGGIGMEQYNSIQNTAARNRLLVNQAQTKLSTDTARQITDLRAQGEFEKADALLEIGQTYLTKLMELQQWAASFNLSVDEFNNNVEQLKLNYEFQVAEVTGMYRGKETIDAKYKRLGYELDERGMKLNEQQFAYTKQQDEQTKLANAGEALLAIGEMPSKEQLAAMGMTKTQAQKYINQVKAEQAAKTNGTGNSSTGKTGSQKTSDKKTGNNWGGTLDNEGLKESEVAALQEKLGVTPDGWSGEQTRAAYKAKGYKSLTEAYNALVGSSSSSDNGSTATKQYNGNSSNSSGKTSLMFYEDEGIFVWNGKSYNSIGALQKALNSANLTSSEEATIKSKLKMFGFSS